MRIIKSCFTIFFIVSFCQAEAVALSGIVSDSAGVGIPGATVFLEKAKITTTTDTGGRFTLSGSMTSIQQRNLKSIPLKPIVFVCNDQLIMYLESCTKVLIAVYDIQGRQLSKIQKTMDIGAYAMSLPHKNAGMLLYKVEIGSIVYLIKGALSGRNFAGVSLGFIGKLETGLSEMAGITALIDDTIVSTKGGYLPSRMNVKKYDVVGIVIKMAKQPSLDTGTVTDIDGNIYKTIKIGDQTWTAENLRTIKYNDGTTIPKDTATATWKFSQTPKYCYYNNSTNTDSMEEYGALYNWYTVKTGKLAPAGWHIPTVTDWIVLSTYLIENGYNWDGTKAEDKIAKSLATNSYWRQDTVLGTIGSDLSGNNRSGFSALPGGSRTDLGVFEGKGRVGTWWSSTEYYTYLPYYCYLYFDDCRLAKVHGWEGYEESSGFSVRLIKD